MAGAEYYGLKENYNKDNIGCTDWEFDSSYGATFGRRAEREYLRDVQHDSKTCGHCLHADIGFCTYADYYPSEIASRGVISK